MADKSECVGALWWALLRELCDVLGWIQRMAKKITQKEDTIKKSHQISCIFLLFYIIGDRVLMCLA